MSPWFALNTHSPITHQPTWTGWFLQLVLSNCHYARLEMKGVKELKGSLLQMVQWERREDQLLVLLFTSSEFWTFLNFVLIINLNKTLYNPRFIPSQDSQHLILVLVLYLHHFRSHSSTPPVSPLPVPLRNRFHFMQQSSNLVLSCFQFRVDFVYKKDFTESYDLF